MAPEETASASAGGLVRRLASRGDRLVRVLLLLTVVTGLADAVSFLGLGRVFVANSTGNVVVLGFALAGASELSVLASLVALSGFLSGAVAGGRLAVRFGTQRRAWLTRAFGAELALVAVATVIAIAVGHGGDRRYALIVPMSVALGVQNSTVRKLAVPDLTTTVLTLTLTGLAADSRLAGGTNPGWNRRSGAVILMLGGAFVGGLLVLKVAMPVALGVMVALLAIAVWVCVGLSRVPPGRRSEGDEERPTAAPVS